MIKENKDFIIIDFTGLFKMLIRRFWIMLLIGVIGAGVAWAYANFVATDTTSTPMYRSRVKLYITGNEVLTPSSNAKMLGQSFFSDYCELMKSKKVTAHIIEDLGLNMTESQLLSCISTQWVSGTCMAYVSVTFPDAQLAKVIVDDVIRVTSAYALEIIGMTPPKVYEESVVATSPLNATSVNTMKYALFGFVGGAVVALMVLILLYFTDRKVRNPEQLSDKAGVPVYASLLSSKKKLASKCNNHAMMLLFEKIYIRHAGAKLIGFYNVAKEKKEIVIEQYGQYLQAIGKKIVVLDTKMFCPVGENGNGLLDYLDGKVEDIATIIHKKGAIDYIDCSEGIQNAVEYLDGEPFEKLLCELKDRYDYVLLNTASLDKTAEAVIVMKKTDVNLFVAECNKTLYPACESFMKQYNENGSIDGVILSNVKGNTKSMRFKKEFGKYFGVN